jgi:hypothetical protein
MQRPYSFASGRSHLELPKESKVACARGFMKNHRSLAPVGKDYGGETGWIRRNSEPLGVRDFRVKPQINPSGFCAGTAYGAIAHREHWRCRTQNRQT